MAVVAFKTKTEDGFSVWDIARELLDVHKGNITAATNELIERADRDASYIDRFTTRARNTNTPARPT